MSLLHLLHLPFDIVILTQVGYVIEWLLRLLALFVVPRNRKPSSGAAWLLIIFLLPVPGWIAFLVLGTSKLPKPRQAVQDQLDRMIDSELEVVKRRYGDTDEIIDAKVDPKYRSLARLAKSLGHLPVLASNQITPIDSYRIALDSIIQDIRQAKSTVYVEYFTIGYDATTQPFFAALRAAADRGVKVHVLYDAFGSRKYSGFYAMKKQLKHPGVTFHAMLPFHLPGKNYIRPDLRNHRKIVVIDHKIGYAGSQNLIDRGYHRRDHIQYHELVVRIKGPIVYQLAAVFATDWLSETDQPLDYPLDNADLVMSDNDRGSLLQLLPSGPGYADENNLKLFTHLLYSAEESITIVNPYFVPTEPLITALVSAAKRGVVVKMVNSQVRDQFFVAHAQRSYYEELLAAGVEIYLRRKPVLVHSKYIVVDNTITVVGSSNLDVRSFELDHELTLIAYDPNFTKKMKLIADGYLAQSQRIDLATWRNRRPIVRLIDNLARLTSSLQ